MTPPPVDVRLSLHEIKEMTACILAEERHALALRLLRPALAVAPHDLDLLSVAGACLRALDHWPEARRLLERAAVLDPTGEADLALAWAALTHGEPALAKAALARALGKDPRHVQEIHGDASFWRPIRHEREIVKAIQCAQRRAPRRNAER